MDILVGSPAEDRDSFMGVHVCDLLVLIFWLTVQVKEKDEEAE